MNAKIKELRAQAHSLSPNEKIELVEDLLQSLDPTDTEIDRAWAEEAQDRLAAYLKGEMRASSLPEILQKYEP